jgi:hypothetical protein
VASIIETAERTAAEMEEAGRREAQRAQREAAQIREQARHEADRILSAARENAKEHSDRTQAALARLTREADELRSSLVSVGHEVTAEVSGGAETPPATTSEPEETLPQRGPRFRRPESPTPVPAGPPEAESEGEGASASAEADETESRAAHPEVPMSEDARAMLERMRALDQATAQRRPRRRWRRSGRS